MAWGQMLPTGRVARSAAPVTAESRKALNVGLENLAARALDRTLSQHDEIKPPPRQPMTTRFSSMISALYKAFSSPPTVVYQPGNDNTDPAVDPAAKTGLANDVKELDLRDYETLIHFLNADINGVNDDNNLLLERLIILLSKLPPTSVHGKQLTDAFVGKLWDGLSHPPLMSLGKDYRYRAADGRNNNIYLPELGAARTPYARSVQPLVYQRPDQPDPGLVFDLLMDRGDYFEPHPNGICSMLFYLGSIITHDVFRTDHRDHTLNLTSSYLELSPLYGSTWEEQQAMRRFENGLLKSDCFSSKRLLGMPPGCSVLLIMFNRFHNYVATQLAVINENKRFPKPTGAAPANAAAAHTKYDEELFQTARLITCGLYVNIILKDYVRTILSLNRTSSTWDLDPRTREGKDTLSSPIPQATGNQVSVEFNLIYRWHSAVSQRDERWSQDRFRDMLGLGPDADPAEVPIGRVLGAMAAWEAKISDDPAQRPVAELRRSADGSFNDDDLVRIFTESVEDVAGSFGANRVPHCMRTVEMLGILQARKWNVATLNEFRAFVGLTKHTTFADINPDPAVQARLQQLYDAPDSVELYPGLVAEKPKPSMAPGSGLCINYTTSRAILSDAVALVRGDRFHTVDYTPKNVTNWGYNEANFDVEIDAGHVMSKLVFRAFPKHFKQDSVYAHFPFVVPETNREILTKLETVDGYSFDQPARQQEMIMIKSHEAISQILGNQTDYKITWGDAIQHLTIQPLPVGNPGKNFCLAGDAPANMANRNHVEQALYPDEWRKEVSDFYAQVTRELLGKYSADLGGGISGRDSEGRSGNAREVDLVRDVANLANARFMAAMFGLPVKSERHPHGLLTEQELYLAFLVIFSAIFFDLDPARSFALRRKAREVAQQLGQVMVVESEAFALAHELDWIVEEADWVVDHIKSFVGGVGPHKDAKSGGTDVGLDDGMVKQVAEAKLTKYGRHMVTRMLEKDVPLEEVVWGSITPLLAAGVAVQSQILAQVVDYYLGDGSEHLPELYRLAHERTDEADDKLMRYMLEASRLRSTVAVWRDLASDQTIVDYDPSLPSPADTSQLNPIPADPATAPRRTLHLKAGTRIFCNLVTANHDAVVFPDPEKVRLDRPVGGYMQYGVGPHLCLGDEMSKVALREMFKAVVGLKGLRRAPGSRGKLGGFAATEWRGQVGRVGKSVGHGEGWTGLRAWMSADQSMLMPVPTTMKIRWDAE